ncbi:signal recognition particle-docking protein FtsY [Tissierella sp. MSJ-40]|uniref:Signal recognition particle receptor FtsY n=1 Tax=Tissierella simiarum TaxID=2841534 RepID=A0ABS6E4Q0_9FIRM|nr:signal recognition particle-docking protein FtsY [Tissierella simiarum]MBU5437734.1 signal recognition particle-docking protein FtsY [Tissierella simiarum]
MFKWLNWKKKDKKNEEEVIEKDLPIVEEELKEEIDEDIMEEELEGEILEEELEEEIVEEEYEYEESIIEKENDEAYDFIEELEEVKETDIEEIIEEAPPKKKGFFEKLKDGLTKTRKDMTDKIDSILKSYAKIDDELFDELEEVLVTADVGVNTTMKLIDRLKDRVREEKTTNPDEIKDLLKEEIKEIMKEPGVGNEIVLDPSPAVILVVGVNGVGKTTTIGKLSHNLKKQGKKVLIAAGDTFRAAAIEQLEEWSNRAGVDFIAHSEGADPAAVIYDGIQAAKARKCDVLICDTAGRLHNKSNLMNELNKIFRVVEREYGEATKEILLVLDATTGQNGINQAKVFKEVAKITGVALTKLDGTAKGGVVIALQSELGLPVKLIGVGEGIEDLQEFKVDDFVDAIFS